MPKSDFVVEKVVDTGMYDQKGRFIIKNERSHFKDLREAVNCYNRAVSVGVFGDRIRLLRSSGSQSFEVLAIGEKDSPVIPMLDFETLSASFSGGKTSQCTLEVF
jgi:hypothetical protein